MEVQTPPFHNPLEKVNHTIREIPVWAHKHWKSLGLATVATLGSAYLLANRGETPENPVVTPASAAGDSFDPNLENLTERLSTQFNALPDRITKISEDKYVVPAQGSVCDQFKGPNDDPTLTSCAITVQPIGSEIKVLSGIPIADLNEKVCALNSVVAFENYTPSMGGQHITTYYGISEDGKLSKLGYKTNGQPAKSCTDLQAGQAEMLPFTQ